jgi:hypothetical protein
MNLKICGAHGQLAIFRGFPARHSFHRKFPAKNESYFPKNQPPLSKMQSNRACLQFSIDKSSPPESVSSHEWNFDSFYFLFAKLTTLPAFFLATSYRK